MVRVMYTGREAIIGAFEAITDETPYYSVWIGKLLIAANNNDDVESGRQKMENLIAACEASKNTDVITIKFHPVLDKSNVITDKSPVMATMVVRVVGLDDNGFTPSERLPNVQYKYMLDSILEGINTKLTPLETRLAALEAAEVDEDEDEGLIGKIDKYSKLLENPAIMGLVEKLAPAIIGFLNPKPIDKPRLVAGTPPNDTQENNVAAEPQILTGEQIEQLNAALNRLAAHCDLVSDLTALANLAEANPMMFKMLLTQLRNQ